MCKSFDSSFTFREWVWCPPSETEENRKKRKKKKWKLGKIRWAAATTGYSRPRLIASVSKHRFACCSCSRARPTTLSWFITRIVPQLLFMIHISLTTTTQQKTNTHTHTNTKERGIMSLNEPVRRGWRDWGSKRRGGGNALPSRSSRLPLYCLLSLTWLTQQLETTTNPKQKVLNKKWPFFYRSVV